MHKEDDATKVLLRINHGDDSVYMKIKLPGKNVLEAATIARAYLLKEFGWNWCNDRVIIENNQSFGPVDFNVMESISAMDCLMSQGYNEIFEYPLTYDEWRGERKQLREDLFQIGKIYILKNTSLKAFKCSILAKETNLHFEKIFIAKDENSAKALVNRYIELLSYIFRYTTIKVDYWEEMVSCDTTHLVGHYPYVSDKSFENDVDWYVGSVMFLNLPGCFCIDEVYSISTQLFRKVYGLVPTLMDVKMCKSKLENIPSNGLRFTFDAIKNIFSKDPAYHIHHILFENNYYNYYGESVPIGFKEVSVIPLDTDIHDFKEIENTPLYWDMHWYDGHSRNVWGITDRYQYPYHEDDDLEKIKETMIQKIAGYVKEGWVYRGMDIIRMPNPTNLISRIEIPIKEPKKKIMALFPSGGLTPERRVEVRAAMVAAAEALTYQEFEVVDERPLDYESIKDHAKVVRELDYVVGFNLVNGVNKPYHETMTFLTNNCSDTVKVILLPWIPEIIPELYYNKENKK